ncbi:MAG: hypothetical protein VW500_02915, partial [Aquiluna sp.]
MSNTTFLIFARTLSESGFLITTERFVPMLVATTRLMGTAIPRAQGQAITRTATADSKALVQSPRARPRSRYVAMDIAITLGTKMLEILS